MMAQEQLLELVPKGHRQALGKQQDPISEQVARNQITKCILYLSLLVSENEF